MTIFPRMVRRLLGACLLAAVLYPASGLADDPCSPNTPDCQPQVQAPLTFSGWGSSGWAFYCTGDHPYFWGIFKRTGASNYTWDNTCFSGVENGFYEDLPNKFDGTFTNWCTNQQNIVVTLGCSSRPPRWQIGTGDCGQVGEAVRNPGCTATKVEVDNSCSDTNPRVCFQYSRQTCSDGTRYLCTQADSAENWCYKCAAQ